MTRRASCCRRLATKMALAVMIWGMLGGPAVARERIEEVTREIYLAVAELEAGPKTTEALAAAYLKHYPTLREYAISRTFTMADMQRQSRGPTGEKPTQTPEEEAAALMKAGGIMGLYGVTEEKLERLLRRNREHFRPLIKADFDSDEAPRIARAARFVGTFEIQGFEGRLVAILKTRPDSSIWAAYAIRDLNEYALIPALIDHADEPLRYFEIMRSLQRNQKAHPRLLGLLKSDDADHRWRAAYALAESRDPALVSTCRVLFRDSDQRVRSQAINIAVLLTGDAYKAIYPDALLLLKDPAIDVRVRLAISLAWKKDRACARTLLALLQTETLEESTHGNVVQAIQNLSGSYFGYHRGSGEWRPNTDSNQQAIKRFAAWIEEQEAGLF